MSLVALFVSIISINWIDDLELFLFLQGFVFDSCPIIIKMSLIEMCIENIFNKLCATGYKVKVV